MHHDIPGLLEMLQTKGSTEEGDKPLEKAYVEISKVYQGAVN